MRLKPLNFPCFIPTNEAEKVIIVLIYYRLSIPIPNVSDQDEVEFINKGKATKKIESPLRAATHKCMSSHLLLNSSYCLSSREVD
jgi:hypothetical protein